MRLARACDRCLIVANDEPTSMTDAYAFIKVLRGYAPEERAGLADEDGVIRARCEFCGTTHEITPESLA